MVRYRLVWVGMVFIMVGMVPWSPGTLVPWSQGTLVGYLSFLRSKWDVGKNLRKNLMVWTSFVFNQFHETYWPHGHQVTRHTGGLSQLLRVKMSWGKKSKKKPSALNIFSFLVNFIRHTGPMVTRSSGTLVGCISFQWSKWAKNLTFLIYFVFWTISSDIQVPWSPGTQVVYLSTQWSNELAKNLR